MRVLVWLLVIVSTSFAQIGSWTDRVVRPPDYVQKRASSYDLTGGNADYRRIEAGGTLEIDLVGPGEITHFWCTIAARDPQHLKALVLRMFWDDEPTPSVEAPIGDFFGLGLGDYHLWSSAPLQVAPAKALNSFFPMPFRKRARIRVTNESDQPVGAFYYNLDYRVYAQPLPPDTLYFHAQYRQAAPNRGWSNQWKSNGDPLVEDRKNLNGEGNYVFVDATGRGQFVGVTLSVLQNQDGWWGEGDDMFLIDGETRPSINGTGSEDYFLGAWDFGETAFSYPLYGAPVKGEERAGSRSSVYRFHLDSPIPFSKALRATIEHGHANARSDNYYSVAYWYQSEPHAAFPPLPPLPDRIPKIHPVGGPGNAAH